MKYKNLNVIGTSHIARQSIDDISRIIEKDKPDIVAVELDKRRYVSLRSRGKGKEKISFYNVKRIGVRGFVFSLIGAWVEKKLGKYVGVMPGSDMLKAIELARKKKIKIALIDQDIEVTLRRFSNTLTWKEKWNFVVDLFKAFILRKKEISFD